MTDELEQLQDANMATLEELASQGFSPDPLMTLKCRLDVLTEQLVEQNVIDGDALEVRWETVLADLLESILSAIRQQQLTEP